MTRLMTAAGIAPQTTQVRSGEAELSRITGAQAPSGIPVVITAPVVERARAWRQHRQARRRRLPWPAPSRRLGGPPHARTAVERRHCRVGPVFEFRSAWRRHARSPTP